MDLNKLKKIALLLLVGVNLWAWSSFSSFGKTENAVYFLDVGQGDAQLVVLDSGNGLMPVKILIDAGEGRRVLDPLDMALGHSDDRYIDIIVMTHPHLDHFGGIVEILRRYEVGLFITNGHELPDSVQFENLLHELEINNVPVLTVKEGAKIRFRDTSFLVISPDEHLLRKGDLNEASIVIMMEHVRAGGKLVGDIARVLFTGDAGFPAEDILLSKGYDLQADILKVGHHGSRHSSGPNFLAEVSPAAAVIGVGNNRYGHPAQEVLGLLELVGAAVYRTDEHGTIKIVLDADYLGEVSNQGGKTRIDTFFASVSDIFTGAYLSDSMTVFTLDELRQNKGEIGLVPYKSCSYGVVGEKARRNVVINEVAWMGAVSGHSHEWIELRNVSGAPVDLSGWQLLNENDRIHAMFPQQSTFEKEYILLARTPAVDALRLNPDLVFSGVIRNSNEGLRLFDNECRLIDEVLAFPSWPAGDNVSKRTMELVSGVWVDSLNPGGTPGTRNTGSLAPPPSSVSQNVGTSSPTAGQSASSGCSPGQININTAPKTDLIKIRHIGDARADSIISNRPYSSVSDMQSKVSGIGESRIKDIISEGLACAK